MTAFTDILDAHAATNMSLLANATVDYDSRTGLSAILTYDDDSAQIVPGARHRSPRIEVTLLNDATTGMTPDEFQEGDTITVQPRASATARTFRLSRIVKQDTAFITVEVH